MNVGDLVRTLDVVEFDGAELSFDVDGRFVEFSDVRVAVTGGERFVTVVLTGRADGEADRGEA